MSTYINILIVDSDPVIIKSAWNALKSAYHSVDGVLSAKKALYRIKKNKYDLVFIDPLMPGEDGIPLIKQLKQSRPDTGIVVMTTDPSHQAVKEAHKLGISSCVKKPFTPEMLKDVTDKEIEWIRNNALETKPKEEFPPSMLAKLDEVIHRRKGASHIMLLLDAQEIFGYIPPAIQKRIAKSLNMYTSEIHSIVSSYSCFKTKPDGDHPTCYKGRSENLWRDVTWMTSRMASNAVNEYIRSRQLEAS